MFKITAVSNRRLCRGDFLKRLGEIALCGTDIILREKDLSEREYLSLLQKASTVCGERIIPHSFYNAAAAENSKRLHVPMHILRAEPSLTEKFETGASIHSVSEAKEAQALGAKYVTAGNIFETDCKKGLPGRGIEFLKELKSCVSIPVYAIGGINENNIKAVVSSGSDGAFIMSGFMQCTKVEDFLKGFIKAHY